MNAEDAPKSRRHAAAALVRWAGVDPDERARRMTELSKLAAAKRKADREASGAPAPKRRPRSEEPLPPLEHLIPNMEAIQTQRVADGLPALSQDKLMREATLQLRRDIAVATMRALKDEK